MLSLSKSLSKKYANRIFLAILLVAFIVYFLLSFTNHYLFKTYSLDLGAYTKCLYDYMHGVVNDSLVYRSEPVNCLASHFDLYLLLLAPFVYVFGTYTLLVIQLISVLLGAWGIYKLIGLYTEDRILPLLAVATFLSFFGVYHAFTFDYHSNVVATMLVPWFFYSFKKRQYLHSSLLLLFILIAKENLSLFMAFVCLGLLWDYRKDKKALYILLIYMVVSLLYFFLINTIVMQHFANAENQRGFVRYNQWGNSYSEIVVSFMKNPLEIVSVLFGNPKKVEFLVCLLFSGGIALLLKTNYLIMIVSLIAQKMLANYYVFWTPYLHYNVEFAPIVVVASFILLASIKKEFIAHTLSFGVFVFALGTLIYTTRYSRTWHNFAKCAVFDRSHYEQTKFDVAVVYSYMKLIPDDASVCASDIFVPHLCLRSDIYTYHDKKVYDTEYMLLYEPKVEVEKLLGDYGVANQTNDIWLLKRRL